MASLSQIAWHCLAEVEALFGGPGRPLFFRRGELRSYGAEFGKVLSTRANFRIHRHGGIRIGERAAFGDDTYLSNFAPIEIGDDFLSAGHLIINTGRHDPVTLVPGAAPVKIGNRVWCGINVTILAGVTIGDDVVIGAGSVVVRDISANSVAAGVPAKVLRPLDRSEVKELWSWAPREEDPV